jgi:hypothetical protein
VSGSTIFSKDWRSPLAPAFPLMPLDEMVARIEAIRLEDEPETCTACGSRTVPIARRCSACRAVKDLRTGFHRDRTKASGYRSICKACKRQYDRPRMRIRRLRRIVERATLRRAS